MKKIYVIAICICIQFILAILLIHKQNKVISLLYDLQKFQEYQAVLIQQKKELFLQLTKEQQLSHVQTFATQKLNMKPIAIKEAKVVNAQRILHEQ